MGKLRDARLREAAEDKRKAATELVSNERDGSQPTRSGFSGHSNGLDNARNHWR